MNQLLKAGILCAISQIFIHNETFSAENKRSGNIVGEVWTKANSPYLIDGDILVAGLQIDPGVQVLFLSNYVFEVAGVLNASGTAQEPILFARSGSRQWEGIFFN